MIRNPTIFILLSLLIFRSVSSGDDVERVEISEIRLSDDGEQFSHDSVLNSKKEQIDSVHSEVDSVEIKEDRDSVGAVVESTTTVTLCSSLSDQKLAKNRRETEIIPYCGISKDADHLAQLVVMDAYRGNWSDVLRGLDRLERIEKRRDLVRISRLLNVSVRTYRLEQNEFLSETERVIAEKELDSCIHIGIAYIEGCKDKYLPLHELIYCGIKGFQVSRIIEKNPVEAAIQGYSVIVRLEKLLQIDSTMYDACMGLGLFYCSVASASAVIRAALALTGRQISLEKGLSYLRTGARMGHYVNIPSLVYLTQFLSPYLGHHAAEKDSIFMVLQKKCESNPRYLFEQIDENICFHPEKFTMEYSTSLRKKITGYKNVYPHLQCYSELMKYQYCMYIDTLNCIFKTDTVVDLKIYGFYPAFLDALRYKEVCMNQRTGPFSKLHVKDCEKNIAELIKKLEAMPMASTRRELYRWHILDAIKLR